MDLVIAQSLQAEHVISFPGRKNQYVDVKLSMPVSRRLVEYLVENFEEIVYV